MIHFKPNFINEAFQPQIQIRSSKKDCNGDFVWTGDTIKSFIINEDETVNKNRFDLCEVGWKDDCIVVDDSFDKDFGSWTPLSEFKSEWIEIVKTKKDE